MKLASGALLVLLLAPSLEARPDAEKVAAQAVKKFRDEYYRSGATPDEKLKALIDLSNCRHARAAATLSYFLTKGTYDERVIVAGRLGRFQGIDAVPGLLMAAFADKANEKGKGRDVRVVILRSLGDLKAKGAIKLVDKCIEDKDVWIAKAAVEAAGKIREKSSIDALVKTLKRLEGPDGDRGVKIDLFDGELPATGFIDVVNEEERRRAPRPNEKKSTERDVLFGPVQAALTAITRVSFSAPRDWRDWWREKRSKFQVPP